MNINDEWENFKRYNEGEGEEDELEIPDYNSTSTSFELDNNTTSNINTNSQIPKATNIYISTKTKIAYLNAFIDLKTLFWLVPVIPYAIPTNGVIKKQIKFNSLLQE